jgi:GNAT superfamily N-acetyltransferase
MSQLAVVRIEATNLGQVRDFLRQEWAAFDRELPGVDDPMQWEKKRYLLRAVLDGQTVAVADFYVMGSVAHLSEIIVGQSWRHRGIGAQLMAAFEEMARAAGCHKLSLRAPETSPAVRFYCRLHYQVEGKMVNHYHGLTFVQCCKFLK